ncbi:hypothetical protein AGDE_06587 [Angomonas deanei]|nr:hypothetical protein AGDE_06587 [Angomonas deanei]|eukprot:EPY37347.1 hypothetical protein AGDE_06587 [Angomonas deanei]
MKPALDMTEEKITKKKKDKVPLPGAKGEPSTAFYSRKKWKDVLQESSLNLQGRALDPRGALIIGTALAKNRYVVSLDLSNNLIGDDGAITVSEMLKSNTSINKLNLSQNGITDIGGIALASAFVPNVTPSGQPGLWNRSLFSLILTGNDLGDDTLLALSNAAACHRDLTFVDLSWNHIGPQGTKCLLRSLQKNPLCNFVLAANKIGDVGTKYLCSALQLYGGKSQTTLNLCMNDISHRGAAAIGKLLSGDERILEVNLAGNTLGFRGVRSLANCFMESKTVVRSLVLRDNMIGDEGAKEIAAIITANVPSLERLDISDNKITDNGSVLIAKSLLSNTHLQVINCQNNVFATKAVPAIEDVIRQSKTITSINLYGSLVSSNHRRQLTTAVNESEGTHVEMGKDPEADGDGTLLEKMEEHLQILADQEAQQKAKEEEEKAKKKKKKKSVA